MVFAKRHGYRHARRAYQLIMNREYAAQRDRLASLLRSFVRRGDLVFDIGAAQGDYTEVLLRLGAHVIAVEPTPMLADRIRTRYPVIVEQAAVGAAAGRMPFHLGVNPRHSTLSTSWLEKAPTQGRWTEKTIEVAVTTIAELTERYGHPAFIKIDVEGAEADVLRGAASLPPTLSFEYQCADLETTAACLTLLEGYAFNHVELYGDTFAGDWVDAETMLRSLGAHKGDAYGDVYARRR